MDDHERLLAIAWATVTRAESVVTRHRAVGLRTTATITRWQSAVAMDESARLAAAAHPPRPPRA